MNNRRAFLKQLGFSALSLSAMGGLAFEACASSQKPYFFDISLAQWSFHKSLFAKKMDNLDFAETAAKQFGIQAVEYVNQFFKDKAKDQAYLKEMLKRAQDNGVTNVEIMIDGEGDLGSTEITARKKAVENHYKWVEAAKLLGCKSIRVNAAGKGTAEEVKAAAIESLHTLSEFAAPYAINIMVENHGGLSSNGQWLSAVLKEVNLENCGTLPDFGNFYEYDPYQGVADMMPFAKGVSAKSYDFDAEGNETKIDYFKMMKIVKDAGFKGYIGIEYEGDRLSEEEGIKKTKLLLEKVGAALG